MGSSTRNLIVGCFILAGIASLGYLSVTLGGLGYSGPGGLRVYATFDEIGGLAKRSPVVVGGVRIGKVEAIELDDSFRARVALDLDPQVELPADSSAAIYTQGVLGDQYVSIEPGGSDELLGDEDEIEYTQSATVLERLIGRLVQGLGSD